MLYALNPDVLGVDDSELPRLACVECDDPLSPPFVYWHGASLLVFHLGCAARIGAHLIADACEAALAADPAPHWRRWLIAGVRHQLELEEAVA